MVNSFCYWIFLNIGKFVFYSGVDPLDNSNLCDILMLERALETEAHVSEIVLDVRIMILILNHDNDPLSWLWLICVCVESWFMAPSLILMDFLIKPIQPFNFDNSSPLTVPCTLSLWVKNDKILLQTSHGTHNGEHKVTLD